VAFACTPDGPAVTDTSVEAGACTSTCTGASPPTVADAVPGNGMMGIGIAGAAPPIATVSADAGALAMPSTPAQIAPTASSRPVFRIASPSGHEFYVSEDLAARDPKTL
jgi:hypothetical protein